MFRPLNPFRTPAQKQVTRDMNTYMPPHIEQAMAEHLQNTMPGHLKKYQDSSTYVPQHAVDAMQQHLQDTLPPHMKQYAGAYMQQNVIRPGMVVPSGAGAGAAQEPAQAQTPGQPVSLPSMPTATPVVQTPAQAQAPAPGVQAPAPDQPPQSRDSSYSFITNPAPLPHKSVMETLPGNGSLTGRLALVGGVLLVLIILIVITRSLTGGGGGNVAELTNVLQDQQEIVHLAANTININDITTANKNFAATVRLSVGSSQTQIMQYMTDNHYKVNVKQLGLKVSTSIDDQLTAAEAATTYNQTFQQIMNSKLDAYANDLQAAYRVNTGKKGRAILSDSFNQIKLFKVQLAAPAG
jgi:hypothetical protein